MSTQPPPMTLDPEDRGYIIATCLWVFTGTSILLQLARLWSRLKVKQLGWDDYWMFVTTATLLAFAIVMQIIANHGGARHLDYLVATEGAQQALYVAKLSWISQPFCIMALGFGKLSVGYLILRFLHTQQRWLKWSILTCIISVNVFFVIAIFLTFFQCTPAGKLWEPTIPGRCLDPHIQTNFSVFAGSWSAFGDLYLAIAPVAIIIRLQIALRKKIGLCIIFSLGLFAGACGFYKSSRIAAIATHGDITWDGYDALLFTGAEIWLIIICGTVPTIVPLIDLLVGRFRSFSARYSLSFSSRSGGRHTDGGDAGSASKENLASEGTGVGKMGEGWELPFVRSVESAEDGTDGGHQRTYSGIMIERSFEVHSEVGKMV